MKSKKVWSAVYNKRVAKRTLNPRYMTAYHVQAQWAELVALKRIIGDVYRLLRRPLTIFDIGIGESRLPLLLSQVATWSKIAKYVGIDNAQTCIQDSKQNIARAGIADKVQVALFDATRLGCNYHEILSSKFDLAVCTYFTAGDFKPGEISIRPKANGLMRDYDAQALMPNRSFVAVFKGASDLLKDGGKVVIGSVYCDNDFTRKIQEGFYRACGMTVITSAEDLFTATREGFWSERFSDSRIYDYLSWVSRKKIGIIPLDDYDFARMIVIDK